MTTKRIDSELELFYFITQLQISGIEIPSNVTLEIDSPIFQSELKKLTKTWISREINMKRFKYMGQKITFKSK